MNPDPPPDRHDLGRAERVAYSLNQSSSHAHEGSVPDHPRSFDARVAAQIAHATSGLVGSLDLDVAALDVAGPRVEGVRASGQFYGKAVPGDERRVLRSAGLSLVEHKDSEPARWRGQQLGVLGPISAVELGRVQEQLVRRLAIGRSEDRGSTTPWSLIGVNVLAPMTLVPASW